MEYAYGTMPPHPPSRPPPRPGGRRAPSLDSTALDRALAAVVPDERDRSFVLRCIVDEGPRHHRVASWALLQVLARILEDLGGGQATVRDLPSVPLRMRVPPAVAPASGDADFPIGMPTRLLDESLGDPRSLSLAIECLCDGPPHHALANAAMVWLAEAIADRVRDLQPPPGRGARPSEKGRK